MTEENSENDEQCETNEVRRSKIKHTGIKERWQNRTLKMPTTEKIATQICGYNKKCLLGNVSKFAAVYWAKQLGL